MTTIQTFRKYEIETINTEEGKFLVKVYNNNAKKEYNRLEHYYTFGTNEARRNEWIEAFKSNVLKREQYKEEAKQRRLAERKNGITFVLKQGLSEIYGSKNVSVTRGKGTAWGWVHAKVTTNKPQDCACTQYNRCEACGRLYRQMYDKVNSESYKIVKKAGQSFGTYYSDDGYNSERSEFLVDIDLV